MDQVWVRQYFEYIEIPIFVNKNGFTGRPVALGIFRVAVKDNNFLTLSAGGGQRAQSLDKFGPGNMTKTVF